MELLQSTNFVSAVAGSKEQLRRISNIVSKYCGQKKAESFLQACDVFDFTTANTILDNTIIELTGYDSVYIALNAFADKFSQLSPELGNKVSAALSESDKVKAINNYRLEIDNYRLESNNIIAKLISRCKQYIDQYLPKKIVSHPDFVYKILRFGKTLLHRSKKSNNIKYTKKDKDLMNLIHELSTIYNNTNQYLNS